MAQQRQAYRQPMQTRSVSLPRTPFPSVLLDRIMPTLRDTEWRLLCVIVRQTLGWHEEAGGRKDRDWLTHSQLKARTGRSSEAVCRAIESLVRRGLIEVEDRQGRRLTTPQERQSSQGQLFFRLAPRLGQFVADERTDQAREGRHEKGEPRTKGSVQQVPKTEMDLSESEITKAKTTKETGYKKRESRQTVIHSKIGDNSASTGGKSLQELAQAEELRSLARQFLRAFQDTGWRMGRWAVPLPVVWARDEPQVIALLRRVSYERLEALADRFFKSDRAWIGGYSLDAFAAFVTRQLAEPVAEANPDEASVSPDVLPQP